MPCELQDRKTEKPVDPEKTTTDWVSGEYDVTGTLTGITDDDWARARDDAVEKARERLMDKYACVGTCEDGFCLLDVKVESNRAGRRVRRTVPNPPDSIPYQQGRRESERTFLTYEVKVSAHCRCGRRSKPPVISSGGNQVLIGAPSSSSPPPPPAVDPPTFEWVPRLQWNISPRWRLPLRYDFGAGFLFPHPFGYPAPWAWHFPDPSTHFRVASPSPTPVEQGENVATANEASANEASGEPRGGAGPAE